MANRICEMAIRFRPGRPCAVVNGAAVGTRGDVTRVAPVVNGLGELKEVVRSPVYGGPVSRTRSSDEANAGCAACAFGVQAWQRDSRPLGS